MRKNIFFKKIDPISEPIFG